MAILPRPASPVCPQPPDDPPPPFLADCDLAQLADICAYLADCPDNHLETYPGPGWDDPVRWPTWTDVDCYALGSEGDPIREEMQEVVADFLAYLADCPDNSAADYPGFGWDDPADWPAWTDAVRYTLGPRG